MWKWKIIFFLGIPYAFYRAIRDPAWSCAVGMYFYFAIPWLEFGVPGKWALIFNCMAVLGSLRYYKLFSAWGKDEIKELGLSVARESLAEVRDEVIQALSDITVQNPLPGEIRQAGMNAGEAKALETVNDRAPAAINISVRRAVQDALTQACDAGEREALKVIESVQGRPKGQMHAMAKERIALVVDEALDKNLAENINGNVDDEIRVFELDMENVRRNEGRGPLGIPNPKGPIGGLLSNSGLWLHLLFAVLTYIGAKTALKNPANAMNQVNVCILLMIPLVTIITAIRNDRHFKLASFAWMLGVFHICMNGVTYWLQFGGRADSAGGQGGEANFLGAITAAVTPIAFGLALNMKKNWQRVIAVGFAGVYFLGILASGSRAGLLAMFAGMGYWMVNTNRKGVAGGLACMAVSCFLAVAPDNFYERMGTILGEKDNNPWIKSPVEPSKHERVVLWNLAIKIWKEHPWMGVGATNYVDISAEETTITDAYQGARGMQTHNSWLQILSEYGIIGFLVWFGNFTLAIWCYRKARMKLRKYPEYGWFGAICLGFESGSLSSAMCLTFNSFQWYDYVYWHMIFGPLALEIATSTAERLEWLQPTGNQDALPPPKYGPPSEKGLNLDEVNLAGTSPIHAYGKDAFGQERA